MCYNTTLSFLGNLCTFIFNVKLMCEDFRTVLYHFIPADNELLVLGGVSLYSIVSY